MSKKAKQYSAIEKSKIVIEAIKGELTIAQITSKYGVHSTQIQQWKKKGLEYLMSGFQNKVKSKHIDCYASRYLALNTGFCPTLDESFRKTKH